MPTLYEVLTLPQLSAFTTAQQCHDWFNETTSQPGDSTPYTWSGIGAKLLANGAAASDVMSFTSNVTTLPGGPLLNACLLSGGLNLADATNRAVITSEEVNEPQWAVNIINAMLAIGAPVATPNWQLYGLSAAPALADIQAILLSKSFGQVAATIQSQIQSSVITTVAGIESAIAPLLATAQANLGG